MVKYTNKRVMSLLKRLKRELSKSFKIEKMYLFGSRARSDYLLSSDVDVILVSKNFKKMKFNKRMAEVLKYWDEDIDLEAFCYTLDEFEAKKEQLGIVQQAVKEGKEI